VYIDPDGQRAATPEDRAQLRTLFKAESQLRREYAESGTYKGQPISQEQFEHSLLDVRARQQSLVMAVAEARDGEEVRSHEEPISFFDPRRVRRFHPVPSRERWERETAENAQIIAATIELPNVLTGVFAGALPRPPGAPTTAARARPPAGPRGRTRAAAQSEPAVVRESPSTPSAGPSDVPVRGGDWTRLLPDRNNPHSFTPSKPRVVPTSGNASVEKGEAGVRRAIAEAKAAGERVLATEVTIDTPAARTRLDILVEKPNGGLKGIECKAGPCARPTPNQKKAHPVLVQNGGIPRGRKAEEAGLVPGKPTGPLEIEVKRYPEM
jgi:hypothetical protein